jgi:uncharacterized membrane protein YtjA (UPF0391 family)
MEFKGSGEFIGGKAMGLLKWAFLFLIVAIIAGLLGFTGIARAATGIARFLFGLFLVIFLILLVLALLTASSCAVITYGP